jgi:hypothetical protein
MAQGSGKPSQLTPRRCRLANVPVLTLLGQLAHSIPSIPAAIMVEIQPVIRTRRGFSSQKPSERDTAQVTSRCPHHLNDDVVLVIGSGLLISGAGSVERPSDG